MKKLFPIFAVIFTAFVLSSFVDTINYKPSKLPKLLRNNYAYIPAGELVLEEEKSNVQAFYMSKTEVTNIAYLEFLADLKRQNKTKELQIAQIDSNQWSNHVRYREPFVNTYHRHPAYHEYPVVNVSKEGAELYCMWLAEQLSKNFPDYAFEARLPNRNEWVWAANGGFEDALFSWGGYYTRNTKGKYLANFNRMSETSIAYDRELKTYVVKEFLPNGTRIRSRAQITTPSKSFFPNPYDLYQMNGNVAELTADSYACGGSFMSPGFDIRNESYYPSDAPSPYIGFRPLLMMKKIK